MQTDLLDILCPERGTFMGILAAYFDESGKAHQDSVVTFCGVCAPRRKVGHFSENWEGLLRYYGLEELHMTEAANPNFALSSKVPAQKLEERIEVLRHFADCINESLEIGLLQAWDVAGFNGLSQAAKNALGDPKDPYYTAFARAMIELARYVHDDDRISLICDDDLETAWDCYRHYRGVRRADEEIRKKTVSLAFADSKAFPAVQAADMVAWLTRREARLQFYRDDFPLHEFFEYLVAGGGKMNWQEMFATKEIIKNLSDADWEPRKVIE